MKSLSRVLPVAACALALLAPPAVAAPATVQLRVEGANRTLFEGSVTTDVRPFRFTGDPADHQCDGTTTGGTSPTAVPTRNAALATASEQHGFAITGTWNASFGAAFTTIAGDSVTFDPGTNRFLGEFKNWQFASVGGCADPIAGGDDILYAYTTGSEPLLRLAGPGAARPGVPFAVTVTDGSTAAPIPGAAVAGATTDGSGRATVTLTRRGNQTLKAEKPGTVRSNAVITCVSDGADGFCGNPTPSGQVFEAAAPSAGGGGPTAVPFVPDWLAPHAAFRDLVEGARFSRKKAPRVLRGTVDENDGVRMVKLRLTRKSKGRCTAYSARRERWIRRPRCGAEHGWWFKVGDSADWEYQLARRLPAGRIVVDVNAIDKAYNRDDKRRRGGNRVVFTVR